MSYSNAQKLFFKEMLNFFNKRVSIITMEGWKYTGELKAFDPISLNSLMMNCDAWNSEGERQDTYSKVVVPGMKIREIYLEEAPFDIEGLAKELEKVFRRSGDIKIFPDAGIITILERVKVTESGIDGTGPVAERVQTIYDRFMKAYKAKADE
ncbi:MAG: Lsm family RNA-binding protein [Candidatus Hodarchaeales archaeon]|jgi:small nuclear ribonucleoprotein (snRNP)-like protein